MENISCKVCGDCTTFTYLGEKKGDWSELVYKCDNCENGYTNYDICNMTFFPWIAECDSDHYVEEE